MLLILIVMAAFRDHLY